MFLKRSNDRLLQSCNCSPWHDVISCWRRRSDRTVDNCPWANSCKGVCRTLDCVYFAISI
jgi:hypothetical protein